MQNQIIEFNRKWKGKEIYNCEIIKSTLNFVPEGIALCCSSTTGKFPLAHSIINIDDLFFDKSYYINAIMQVFESMQNGTKCKGCKKLEKTIFKEWDDEQIKIRNINWNHFKGCNSHCVYCNETTRFKKYYEPIEIVNKLDEEGLLSSSLSIAFGGGEPTLLDNLEQYIKFGLTKHCCEQVLNTSGLLKKDFIKNALLENDNFWVQISVDSGTPETYLKVKKQSGFYAVWNTIKDYCSVSKHVLIKYIVFSYNSDKSEIDAFIQQCNTSGVRNVCVSAEMMTIWNPKQTLAWNYGDKELDATAYMIWKLVDTNIAVFFPSGIYPSEKYKIILNIFVEKYLRIGIHGCAICIWGMGTYSKQLFDILAEYGIAPEYFGDNDVKKQGTKYREHICLSLEQIKSKAKHNRFCIFVAISHYEEVFSQLKQELPNTDVKVLVLL